MTFPPRAAVFFDRDGVLNRASVRDGKPYPPQTLAEFQIIPGAAEGLARLKELGFMLVVVTNQPDIARGSQSLAVVQAIHEELTRQLPVDDVLFCPHDACDACNCRKPRPGLFLRAAERHDLDLKRSFMVGDRWQDMDAGHAVGCTTVFIDFAYAERAPSQEPRWRVYSLHQAIALICRLNLGPEANWKLAH